MDLLRYMGRRARRVDDVTPNDMHTSMRRDLGVLQLTLLGIGSTIGAGIYVIIGVSTRDIAGPAIVVSFFIAGVATFMTSLCFAQYALRIPRGSLYMYVVCTFGELIAFVVTWESMTGAGLMASVTAQGFSSYLDTFLDSKLSNFTREYIGETPFDVGDFLLEVPDVLAGITAIMCTILVSCVSVKYFASVTSFLAVLNSVVLVVFVGIGLQNANVDNWKNVNHGGFAPFGLPGILKGASICISAYAGFKCICMAAEETKNPNKNVPRSLAVSAIITSIVYTLVSIAFTLLVPFWLVGTKSPLVDALEFADSVPLVLSIIMHAGPIFGMLCAMTLTIYGVSRLLFSIADNGLLWSKFAAVSKGRQVPMIASFTVGVFVAFFAMTFDLSKLVSAIALGALMTMVIFSYGTLFLIYKPHKSDEDELNEIIDSLIVVKYPKQCIQEHLHNFSSRCKRKITSFPLYFYVVIILCLSLIIICLVTFAFDEIVDINPVVIASLILTSVCWVWITVVISSYPKTVSIQNVRHLPGGPLLPLTSGFVNLLFFVGGCDVSTVTMFIALNATGLVVYIATCVVDYVRGTGVIKPRYYTHLSVEEQNPSTAKSRLILPRRSITFVLSPMASCKDPIELFAY